MKIILKKDVIGLGYKDEVLTVKDGYGRNYLLPQGYAVLATEKAVKALNEELKQRARKIEKIKADAEAKAAQYEGVSVKIEAKVSEGKNIYGSVGPKEIAAALAQQGIEVDSKLITMKAAKAIGNYEALVHFHREVVVTLPVEVVPEPGSIKAKPAPAPAPAPEAEEAEEELDIDEALEEARGPQPE